VPNESFKVRKMLALFFLADNHKRQAQAEAGHRRTEEWPAVLFREKTERNAERALFLE